MRLREQTRQIGQVAAIRPISGTRRTAGAILLVLAAFALQGCSSWPDWANPGKWYDGVFGDEPTTSSSASSDQVPVPTTTDQSADQSSSSSQGSANQSGGQKGFPNLATVPARPPESSSGERRAMQQSLAADRDSARYTNEDLRGQPASAAPTPPTVPNATTAGATTPAPATTAAAPAAPAAATPPPPAAKSAAPAAPTAGTAPVPAVQQAALAPPPAPPKPPPQSTPAPPPARPTAASVAPPPPANLATSVAEVYRQALQQSAATVTTAPADPHFVPPRGQPVPQFATAVPPIVQQNYNASLAVQPPPLPSNGAPARRGAGGTAFAAAGWF